MGGTGRKITTELRVLTVAKSDLLNIAVNLQVHNVVKNNLGAEPLGWAWILTIRSGPRNTVRNPGKFSTSVV